ncbi:hypothetical protein H6P81_012406 [Aristolochia fimbriata]|uniref:Uncharacterized protein n=1 Tax=Aristolochia fimbriata TaxID=158543 RepID=A0AAV7EC12_ARIFI|nr:hypothetical protein H6P81_012406 [Aristolochia fimbriata]
MMAASMARGSSFLRSMWSTRQSASFLRSSRPRTSPSSPFASRGLQRKSAVLSSLLPLYSAIASSCLVCRLPSEVASSFEGRFANYLSPI